MEQKIQKKFFIFHIISFEFGVKNSLNLEHDTCHWHSMCQQTPKRTHLQLGEIFFKSTSLRVMEKLDKSALMGIFQVLGTLSHVDF